MKPARMNEKIGGEKREYLNSQFHAAKESSKGANMIGENTSGLIFLTPARLEDACSEAMKREEAVTEEGREPYDLICEALRKENERMRSFIRSIQSLAAFSQDRRSSDGGNSDDRRVVVTNDSCRLSFVWIEEIRCSDRKWRPGIFGGMIYHQDETWSIHT